MTRATGGGEAGASMTPDSYETLADLYAAASPGTQGDRALVAGYWHQVIGEEPDFDSQTINRELKHLGHGISNITRTFDRLQQQRPQPVIQTKKSGTARQARKRFELTEEGKRAVEGMLSRSNE
jgi:hypothetical protein